MKTFILTFALVAGVVATSFADGYFAFRTIARDAVLFSLDGATAAPVPTNGTIDGFGTVNYEIYSTTAGTHLTLSGGKPNFTGWNATAVGPVTYGNVGLVTSVLLTLPGPVAGEYEVEVVAYTGTLGAPTMYGFSGMSFDGSNTVTFSFNGVNPTNSTGILGWSQEIGNPATTPPGAPGPIPTGTAGLGSIVLEEVPEPGALPLLGMALVTLGLLRRKRVAAKLNRSPN